MRSGGFCRLDQGTSKIPRQIHSRGVARQLLCSVAMSAPDARTLNQTSSTLIEAAIGIHRAVGPGLLESGYLTCLVRDLPDAKLRIEPQKAIPLRYKSIQIDCAYRADLVVNECVVIEVKALESLTSLHRQQIYTYLRLGNYPLGLVLNFGAATMKQGIMRVVNNFPDQ